MHIFSQLRLGFELGKPSPLPTVITVKDGENQIQTILLYEFTMINIR